MTLRTRMLTARCSPLAVLVGVLMLTACSGGGDDDARAASAATGTTPDNTTAVAATTPPAPDDSIGTEETDSPVGSDCPVSEDAVKAATGAESVTGDAPHGGYPGGTTCAWYLDDPAAERTISVMVLRGGRDAFGTTANAPDGPDSLQDGEPYESVTGLGDQALASGVGGYVNLDVLDGDDWVNITAFDYPGADPSRATAKGLSTDALDGSTRLAQAALEAL